MAAKFYVGVNLNGRPQYYVRDAERMVNKRWTAIPTFHAELSQSTAMLEQAAIALVKRLRLLQEDPWLQTLEGQRIKPPEDGQPEYIEDTREPVHATLDDENSPAAKWYIVRPARTPNGPKWFVHYDLPGRPKGQDTIFSDSALEALERAKMLHVLDFCEKAPAIQQSPQLVTPKVKGPAVRPADRWRL